MTELDDRRQQAREAFYDTLQDGRVDSFNEAIETATRVRITPEIAEAFLTAPGDDPEDIWEPLRVAFRAAGFEVED